MSNHARSTKWWPKIASPIASRPAQTFSDSILTKSWSGRAEKTNDLRDRCCYHARVLLVAATSRRTQCQFTNEERKARTGITTFECVASVTEAQFPRHGRNSKQNKRKVRSS